MRLYQHILPLILLSICFVTCGRFGEASYVQERHSYKVVSNPPWSKLDRRLISILTLGHKSLYEDLVTIWAIQFLADPQLKQKTAIDELAPTLKSIANLHPRIEGFYLLSCFILAIDFKAPQYCEEISVAGLMTFPNSWRIPMTQGFVATLIENNDIKAAGFYQLAATRPNSPAYVSRLADRFAKRGFADGQDLNETADLFKEVPGGTKLIEILREKLQNTSTPPRTNQETEQ